MIRTQSIGNKKKTCRTMSADGETKNMMTNSLPKMLTIRETAKTGILPEHCIRQMVKKGEIPCVYAGSKALINFDRLVEFLNDPKI